MELKLKRLGKEYTVFLDDEDAVKISGYRWQIQMNKTGIFYARGSKKINGKWVGFYMHRILMSPENRAVLIDHIDGNGLDNRRSNLRKATRRQNAFNSRPTWKYKLKGIEFDKGRWAARMEYHGLRISLGRFDTKEDAATAYDLVASKLHGEFARLNFASEQEVG